jgi:pyruvate dehydrogenase E2 component (dihydrolipoamide acetyltransferase)
VDLETITGSGPGGRITREDVHAATEPIEVQAPRRPPAPERTGDERVRLSMLRRTIAEHMTRSWSEIPHVTTFDEVDATRLLAARSALAARHGVRVPIEALVIKAVIPALRAFREFNATLDGDDLVLHGAMDIGIAVDTGDGLLVPAIKAADGYSTLELAEVIADLGERGKKRTLTPAELSGGTFTVSNIGAVGGGFGTPLIPHGTTAIVSIGRAAEAAVVRAGQVAIATMMPLSLSYDHRVIDGGLGRRFTAMLVENLEEPALFLA